MPDNVVTQDTDLATIPKATTIATEDVGAGVQAQRVKIISGAKNADGGDVDWTALATLAGIVAGGKAAVKAGAGDMADEATMVTRLTTLLSVLPAALVSAKLSVTTASMITPSWGATTTAVLTPQMLAKGAVKAQTFSTIGTKGGYLKVRIFRSGATAIDQAIQVRLRRVTGDTPPFYGAAWFAYTCGKTTAVAGVAAGSGNGAGVASLTLNAAKTFAAGPNGDIQLGVIDNTTTPTTASEFLRQSIATSTTVKLLEFPTQSAHNSTSHVVADQAEVLEIWCDGGETHSLSIDYGLATTGDSVYIDAYFEPYNSDGAS